MRNKVISATMMVILACLVSGCIKPKKNAQEAEATPVPMTTATPAASEAEATPNLLEISGTAVIDAEQLRSLSTEIRQENDHEVIVLKAKKILIGKDIIIKTEGIHLNIEAEHLLVEGKALIKTFENSDKAPLGKPGRNGGRISIQANIAEGELEFVLNGENGGDGLPGNPPDTALQGERGLRGIDGWIAIRNDTEYGPAPHCFIRPTTGLFGPPGKPGYAGNDGLQGGDAATLSYHISDINKASLFTLEQKPGSGGAGGVGGAGGAPGDQGPNGLHFIDQDVYSVMPHFKLSNVANCNISIVAQTPSPSGHQGPAGNKGANGRPAAQ